MHSTERLALRRNFRGFDVEIACAPKRPQSCLDVAESKKHTRNCTNSITAATITYHAAWLLLVSLRQVLIQNSILHKHVRSQVSANRSFFFNNLACLASVQGQAGAEQRVSFVVQTGGDHEP